jgi:hypothetical protein
MATRIFTLEALQAAHGDCLLLHYGQPSAPRLISIDGGPKGIYASSLAPRLAQIRKQRGGAVLEMRMVMVSHIDDDHITGILDFTHELRRQQDAGQAPSFDLLTLWHNSFDDLIGKLPAEVQPLVRRRMAGHLNEDAQAIAASVKQGRDLRIDADALALNVNSGFDDLVTFEKDGGPIDMGQGLQFTVLGPRKAEVDALRNKWSEEVRTLLKKARPSKKKKASGKSAERDEPGNPDALDRALTAAELDAVAAAFVDKSIPNLSSIVVLAECAGKSILLTGDARGDFILESLKEANRLTSGKIHVDALKAPHHGSDRDVTADFFRAITADHYVFSANGKYGNPDPETFKMLFEARPKGTYTLWLTNPVKPALKVIASRKPSGVKVQVRKDDELSVKIELGMLVGV